MHIDGPDLSGVIIIIKLYLLPYVFSYHLKLTSKLGKSIKALR
jgi:hypothetical protein